jgi:holo-[acyl-carrier protein] synthase
MIIGIGNDMIDIRRVERTSDGWAARAASYAKRFAAKEACAKALGTGFRKGVFWRDMGVVNLPSGRPTLELTGGAALALARLTPEGHEVRIDLSITDDFPTAQAIVIISAVRIPRRD